MRKRNNTVEVSIIIPTYNRGWIIKEAIDSVMAQDYRDFELIIVDDGSTDNTPAILHSYRDEILVFRQENQGVSAARNRGLAAASGDLIAFLDSDDLWLPQKLKRQVDFFNSNPDAFICQTEEIWIRNNSIYYIYLSNSSMSTTRKPSSLIKTRIWFTIKLITDNRSSMFKDLCIPTIMVHHIEWI